MHYDVLALALLFGAILWWLYRRDRERIRAERSGMFNDVLDLLDDPVVTQDDVNFPVLKGSYKGRQAIVEPLADHVAVRKLPSLWLLVTVRGDLPCAATLDYLVRPHNTEFYSPSARLPETLEVPPGWPQQHAILRTDDSGALPPLDMLAPHMQMFGDQKMKELVIAPRGVRLVYQLDQATRSSYLLLRQLEFGDYRLDPALLRSLLDRAAALVEELTADDSQARRAVSA